MTIPLAQTRHIFGVRTGVAGNILYQDEQTVLYPSGATCVLYNIDRKNQKFIPASEKSTGVTAIALGPNRRYAAVAETGEKATVTVYDLHTLRRRKILSSPEVQSAEYVSLAFSPDTKYLVAQGGAPDWTLVYWAWEKSKVLAFTKSTNPQTNAPIYQVLFNPADNTCVSVAGKGVLRVFRYIEGNLKQSYTPQKGDLQNFPCHAWLGEDRMLVGTDFGKLLLVDSWEIKHEFSVLTSKPPSIKTSLGSSSGSENSGDEYSGTRITTIAASSRGFACACGMASVHVYDKTDKTDEKDLFKKIREIKIPQDPFSADPGKAERQIITSLAISPSEENLVCSTNHKQLYCFTLATAGLGKTNLLFEPLSQSFHSNHVTGVDVCIRKPLIATCSLDGSVRIWNYDTCQQEIYKEFAEEAYSIALHPSGLYILVGFSDKLRLMNVLIDDIRTFKEFTIRGCKECSFSNGGHMFAAAPGNIIQLFSTTTFDNTLNLKGHNGKVQSLVWSTDDSKLVSCGVEGALYEWDPYTGRRVGEFVVKSCCYTSVAITPDGKSMYAVGSDKTLKEVSDSQVLRNVETGDIPMTSIVMSRSGRMLFTGTGSGTLRCMKFPLTVPGEWTEHQGHGAAIIKMKISFDDQYLITVSEDACVLIWKIQDKEGRGLKRDKEVGYAEEILITKSDLEEKNQMMSELKQRVDELKMENEYQLRLKDMNYNEKIKEMTDKFVQEMDSLKTKNQVLKSEKEKDEANHQEEVSVLQNQHLDGMLDLETSKNQQLMLEYEKFQELQAKSQKMQEDYERQLQEMEENRERALEEINEYYENKLQEMTSKLEESHNDARQKKREHEETKRQIEQDADQEILNMKNKYEHHLHTEKDTNQKLKGETGIMRKKFHSLQKEIEDLRQEIRKKTTEVSKLKELIQNLRKDMDDLKREISERDDTIQDKEKRIYDLKKKNQELEKFKFVLDYKIKELKKQIEPRENDIKAMKEQIQEMESELERFYKQNTQLELNITELRQKLKATDKEMHQERQRVRDVGAVLEHFKTDLHNCVGHIQDPKKLNEVVRALYQKHVQEGITDTAGVDADIQNEYTRQREHLERTISTLRRKLSKDTEIHRKENIKIMQENVSLIAEINDLRRELKTARTMVHDLEASLGLHRKNVKPMATEILAQVTSTNKNAQLVRDVEEKNKVIDIQKCEMLKLRNVLREIELTGVYKGAALGKLAPVTAGKR